MSTIRETIIAAFVARLQGIPGLASVELMPSAAPDAFPALAIDDFGNQAPDTDARESVYTMTLQIEGFVQAPAGSENPGEEAHALANALYADCVRAILAAPDRMGEAGGNVDSVQEGALAIDVAALATSRTISFALSFDIQFRNRSHDPSLA